MQPDYSQLWHQLSNGQAPDTQFYNFFEDSLNQFISANSGDTQIESNIHLEKINTALINSTTNTAPGWD